MPKYRIKRGQSHFFRDPNLKRRALRRVPAGTVIELTESQAKPFMDKLELVGPTEVEEKAVENRVMAAKASEPILKKVGDDQYNLVNQATGKNINDKPLTLEEAKGVLSEAKAAVT